MKRTPLARKSPLKAKSPMKRRVKRKKSTDKRWRSEPYLAWVRTLPCCACGVSPCDAHHAIGLGWGLSGMGLTAPDSYAMPLCRLHHTQVHGDAGLQKEQPAWLIDTLAEGIKRFDDEELEQAQEFVRQRAKLCNR